MTYPVYAQKARLPQRRPRFLFHRPRTEHHTHCPLPRPPAAVYGQGASRDAKASRDTKEILRLRDTETSKLRDIKATRCHAGPLSDLNRPTPPATTDRQLPPQPQPATHKARTSRPLPRHKKTGSRPRWGSFPIILLQARAYFYTVPDAASRRLLRCLR